MTFLVLAIGMVSACGYHDHGDCKVDENTIVEGRIYFEENNKSAGDADVTVTCYHNGASYTNKIDSANWGFLKGTYFTMFPQSKCIAGDKVIVSATKGSLAGSNTGTVIDWVTQKCLDIDLALINVPLVPEFGVFVGALTLLSAVGIFFMIRKKGDFNSFIEDSKTYK